MLTVEAHPLLELAAFVTRFSAPPGPSPEKLRALLAPDADAPLHSDDAVRAAVRDLLRLRGYKPTGRGKPASEYLLRGAPIINTAVDACNAVSLHSGLPISVIDLDRARPPLKVAVAPAGSRYLFNSAGQEIDVEGLPCLFDADGPCANAVKDAQRTKTSDTTTNTLSIIWGTNALSGRTKLALDWYRQLLEECGARVEIVERG